MKDRLRFLLNRIGERLWVKPLIVGVLATAGVFLARQADYTALDTVAPNVTVDSGTTLLSVMSSSMLVIATLAVASMVSAYASASSRATPRSLTLVIADDVSQNALSAFIGTFIFSLIALIAVENSYYDRAGRFVLFVLTLLAFALVIVTFVRWVDCVARLGQMATTIDKVEAAAASALKRRRGAPTLGGAAITGPHPAEAQVVFGKGVGYVQRVDVAALESWSKSAGTRIEVAALPGTFAAPGRPLAYVTAEADPARQLDLGPVAAAFLIGNDRTFDEDPRFGLIALSEIASRALSPAVNDPGTAIEAIGTLVRLLVDWSPAGESDEPAQVTYARVAVPEIALEDLFDDAFSAIARDGAGTIEVVVRLQKGLAALAESEQAGMRSAARQQARQALARAVMALGFPDDVAAAQQAGCFAAAT